MSFHMVANHVGNKMQVTVFGESAGAISISLLFLNQSTTLFSAAVSPSLNHIQKNYKAKTSTKYKHWTDHGEWSPIYSSYRTYEYYMGRRLQRSLGRYQLHVSFCWKRHTVPVFERAACQRIIARAVGSEESDCVRSWVSWDKRAMVILDLC